MGRFSASRAFENRVTKPFGRAVSPPRTTGSGLSSLGIRSARESAPPPDTFDDGRDQIVVVNLECAGDFGAALVAQIEPFFFDRFDAGCGLAGHFADRFVDVITAFVHGKGKHWNRKIGETHVGEPASEAYPDARKILLFELGEHDREPLIDRPGFEAHVVEHLLHQSFVVHEARRRALRRTGNAEAKRGALRVRSRSRFGRGSAR